MVTSDRRRFIAGSFATAGLAATGASWSPSAAAAQQGSANVLEQLGSQAVAPATLTLGASSFVVLDSVLTASVPLVAGTVINAITIWGSNTSGASVNLSAAVYSMAFPSLSPLVVGTASIPPATSNSTAFAFAGIAGAAITSDGSLQIRSPFALSPGQTINGIAVEHTPPAASSPTFVAASSPYRYDSRGDSRGRLGANEERVISLPIAVGYSNAVANLTVTGTVGVGYVSVYRAGIPWPGNSNLNWTGPDQTDANLVITPTTNGAIIVRAGENQAHIIIDFIGSLA